MPAHMDTQCSIHASALTSEELAGSHPLGLAIRCRDPSTCKSFLELWGKSQPRSVQSDFSYSKFCSGCWEQHLIAL